MGMGGTTTQKTSVDPQSQSYINQMRQAALGYQGNSQPLPPWIQQAQQQYGGYANAGGMGLGALTGGPNPFLNPYQSQMDPYFAQQRSQAVQGANDQATLAGAFGGDRSQIGAATAGNLADQNAAQFRYQGFNDAQNRALQTAQMGFGAIGANAFLPQQYAQGQLGLLQQGMGPYGQTQTLQQTQNPWQTALGLGLIGASFIPGVAPLTAATFAGAGAQSLGGRAINK